MFKPLRKKKEKKTGKRKERKKKPLKKKYLFARNGHLPDPSSGVLQVCLIDFTKIN